MVGSLKAPTYVQLMDWQANKAQQHLNTTGQITVIVQDNASVHRSQLTHQQIQRWQAQGLFLFFLPPYSPQMNRIEDEWLHLKRDELSARVFEDEYDLAIRPWRLRSAQSQFSKEFLLGQSGEIIRSSVLYLIRLTYLKASKASVKVFKGLVAHLRLKPPVN